MTTLNQYIRLHKHVVTLGASVALVCTAYSLWKWTTAKSKDQAVYKAVKDDEFVAKEHNVQRAVKQSHDNQPHDGQLGTTIEPTVELKKEPDEESVAKDMTESNTITLTSSEQNLVADAISPIERSYVLAEECLVESRLIDDAIIINNNITESKDNVTAKDAAASEGKPSNSVSRLAEQFELLNVDAQSTENSDDETNESATTVAGEDNCTTVKPTKIPTIEKVVDFNDCHIDELSSIKSNSLSAATSSNGDIDIHTPEHEEELNTNISLNNNNHNTKQLADDDASQVDTLSTTTPRISTAINNIQFGWNESLMGSYKPNDVNFNDIPSSIGSLPHTLPSNESIDNALQNVKEHATNIFSAFPSENQASTVDFDHNNLASSRASILSISSSLTPDAPEFVPKSMRKKQHQHNKKQLKKHLSREQLIEQQRQHNTPKAKARCSHWPFCTNNNCKFVHPYKPCRAGDECVFGNKCMFLHPSDL